MFFCSYFLKFLCWLSLLSTWKLIKTVVICTFEEEEKTIDQTTKIHVPMPLLKLLYTQEKDLKNYHLCVCLLRFHSEKNLQFFYSGWQIYSASLLFIYVKTSTCDMKKCIQHIEQTNHWHCALWGASTTSTSDIYNLIYLINVKIFHCVIEPVKYWSFWLCILTEVKILP